MEEVISSCEPHKNLDIFREGSVAEWHKCDLARWGGHPLAGERLSESETCHRHSRDHAVRPARLTGNDSRREGGFLHPLPIRSPRDALGFSSGHNWWIFQPPNRQGCDEDRPGNKPSDGHSLLYLVCPKQSVGPTNGDRDCPWGGQFRGDAPLGRGAFSLATSPAKAAATHTQAPYLPGCETIISEVGVMHDDRPRPLHPNAPCPSPECCRASTSSQLGTGEILPQQPLSLLLSLLRSVSQGKAMIHSPKVSPSLATNALKPIAAPAPSVRQCTPPPTSLLAPNRSPKLQNSSTSAI
ncbi:uncharacterized protein K444DRAFT_690943 [Hyaloscypha bicolor E]|uniref:Uncharacterized protein n=1 Tax=Hyaloscypha bicolor E TaxID=1095630 RepID=A0A2J6T4N1_9HELO|nr:uncharacterized protein K444DRAFT_690943 [Hyaloscypha bicolor E]PMD57984.1 hypothetical protein K444DRAFT_690943 [Hyaloscypha bicolor E]